MLKKLAKIKYQPNNFKVIEDGDREFIVRGKGFFKSLNDIEKIAIEIANAGV